MGTLTKLTKLSEGVDLDRMAAGIAGKRRAWREKALRENGFPDTVSCPECGDLGTQPSGRTCWCRAGRAITEDAARERDWEDRVPRRVRGFRLSTAPDGDAAARVRAWLGGEPWETGRNLVLTGPPGTGKTGLGVAALRWAHERDRSVAMVNVAEWVELMRPTDDPARREEQERTTRRALRCRLLLLDDLGAERATEWTTSKVYAVVNARYDAGLPTIATTNATRKALNATYGERVVDRLFEQADAVVMAGANLRRPAAQAKGAAA